MCIFLCFVSHLLATVVRMCSHLRKTFTKITQSHLLAIGICVFFPLAFHIFHLVVSLYSVNFFSSFILWCVRKECRFHLNKFYWCFTDFFDISAWRNNAMINEWTNILHQPNDGTRTLCEMQFVFRECVMIGQSANFIFIRSNNIVANVLTLCVFSFVFFCCCSFAFWLNN